MSSPENPGAPGADAYASCTLDHHGLVAGLLDELGLVEKIDAMIPQDLGQRQVSVGMAVKAMILIGLGFVQRALYLTPDFFRGKPVGRLLGPGITAEMLNDDALGRALDAIFAFGVEAFYFLLASDVVGQLGLSGAGGHLDSTSFHVDGEYNSGDGSAAAGVVHIRQGYSRDHRPDLNQVVLQLVVESQAGIPLLMAAAGGNVNDQAGFHGLIQRHKAQLSSRRPAIPWSPTAPCTPRSPCANWAARPGSAGCRKPSPRRGPSVVVNKDVAFSALVLYWIWFFLMVGFVRVEGDRCGALPVADVA